MSKKKAPVLLPRAARILTGQLLPGDEEIIRRTVLDQRAITNRQALRMLLAGNAFAWTGTGLKLLLLPAAAPFLLYFAGGMFLGAGLSRLRRPSRWRRAGLRALAQYGLERKP